MISGVYLEIHLSLLTFIIPNVLSNGEKIHKDDDDIWNEIEKIYLYLNSRFKIMEC